MKRNGLVKDFLKDLSLSSDKNDIALYNYVKAHLNKGLYNKPCTSRGDLIEMVASGVAVNRDGKNGVSKGDFYYAPLKQMVEVKAISRKSGAHAELKGSICKNYLVFFINKLEWRLIPASQMIATNGKYLYKDNESKGVRVEI